MSSQSLYVTSSTDSFLEQLPVFAVGMPHTASTPVPQSKDATAQLDQETILRIFSMIIPDSESALPRAPHLFKLSSICRRWRDIVVNTPCLWATVDCSMAAKLMIERAKDEPLVYNFGSSYSQCRLEPSQTADLFKVLEPGFVACQVLYFSAIYDRHRDSSFRDRAFPLRPVWNREAVAASSVARHFAPFTDIKFPVLRDLRLDSGVITGDNSISLSKLTKLSLYGITGRNLRPTMRNLCRALAHMDQLGELTLVFAVWRHPTVTSVEGNLKRIQLPHLTYLEIDDHVSVCAQLLQTIEYPESTTYNIFCHPDEPPRDLATGRTVPDFSSILIKSRRHLDRAPGILCKLTVTLHTFTLQWVEPLDNDVLVLGTVAALLPVVVVDNPFAFPAHVHFPQSTILPVDAAVFDLRLCPPNLERSVFFDLLKQHLLLFLHAIPRVRSLEAVSQFVEPLCDLFAHTNIGDDLHLLEDITLHNAPSNNHLHVRAFKDYLERNETIKNDTLRRVQSN